jgi:AraC family transcriptional regulator
MRIVDPTTLDGNCAFAVVARSSAVAPEFVVAENRGTQLLAARWRRRRVRLTEPVRLTDHLLSYCAAGSARCTIIAGGNRCDHMQHTGALTFLHADQPVQWELDAERDIVHLHLYLSEAAVRQVAAECVNGGQCSRLSNLISVRHAWLESYFKLLICEYEQYATGSRLHDSLFLDQTASLLIGRLLSSVATGNSDAGNRRRISPLRPLLVRRVSDFVLQHLRQGLRLQQLAALTGLSVDHFVRAFRQATGTTPHQHVLELRLNCACEMLRNESTPVAVIALRCGFSSPARFSVAFHRRHGLTPTQYRSRH